MDLLTTTLEWSRLQFAMTAMYHWLFVPLTLGLGVIMSIMETMYVKTGDLQWKSTAKFWQKIFGINFAIGVATGIILEFQFGTNWSNYSWIVGDIFGAPLAIEGIIAFFMEATFISIMFFGWTRVSKKAHLASTWLTILGATISAWWILVANSWMQYPTGMEFNPLTTRNEMVSFVDVALSPVAVNKFFHTVISSWILGSAFVIAVASWYYLKKRDMKFAIQSFKVAAIFGFVACLLTFTTGHESAKQVAEKQPMKLAAMEALYDGKAGAEIIIFAVPNPSKDSYNDGKDAFLFPPITFPDGLSLLSFGKSDAYVAGINNIIAGGYPLPNNGGTALSFEEKKAKGTIARTALKNFKEAEKNKDQKVMDETRKIIDTNYKYFGYSFVDNAADLVPPLGLTYWGFHLMVYSWGALIFIFFLIMFFVLKKKMENKKWLLYLGVLTAPLAYVASQAGWVTAEVGRQPWAIQDILPVQASLSAINSSSVMLTFFIFLILFTALLIAEVKIMASQLKKGPEPISDKNENN